MNFGKVFEYNSLIVDGILVTLGFTLASLFFGFLISIPLAIIKESKIKVLRFFGYLYTDIFRGVPALVQLYLVYFALPQILHVTLTVNQAAILALSLNQAAYLSEAIRGGIESIPAGQREAAKALGISYMRTMFGIILPQAFKNVLPSLANETINLLKGTSLVSIIGAIDIMRVGRQIMADTYLTAEPLLVVAAIYYIMVKLLSVVTGRIEKRMRISDRR